MLTRGGYPRVAEDEHRVTADLARLSRMAVELADELEAMLND